MTPTDVSPVFRYNRQDHQIIEELLALEGSPQAIVRFSQVCCQLTDYAYWFVLGTLWVNYSGHSDLNLWRRLFASRRPNRELSLMKPSELKILRALSDKLTAYRAHRPDETDWIAYTLDPVIAGRFARERVVDRVTEYRIRKRDVAALFLRRGEVEVICLDPMRAKRLGAIPVVIV